ncbi:uncharacterized protein LOC114718528 isoform X2 [Neltuma alba]|uniref:uncharacterized protein LOC114718528 isoform X2 n=1 Tax=Neltuma alba TaxID=207710 RepID=UPI0010A54DC4|nr:uncharacterized protein LOC114718528 isoform X2 [Prosopis alba]
MDNHDHRRIPTPGHESHGVHLCHKCGWPFPNPHPSAKHRRAHKRICGTIEGYKLFDSEGHPHSNASDDSDDDHKTPSPKPAMEMNKNEKGGGGIGEKIKRSEDEVFSDAVTDFSDGGLSSDSTIHAEKFNRNDPKLSELSENKTFDAASGSQLIVESSEDLQMQNPEALKSEEVEAGKTSELPGQPLGFIVEPSSFSDSDLKTEASTVVHSDDSLSVPSNSHHNKAEATSDVIPEMGKHVTDSYLTSVAETNSKGMGEIESDRDVVEIAKSSSNVVDEICEKSSKIEVSDEVTASGEMADGAAALDHKYNATLSSVVPQDNVLPSDSVTDSNASTNVVQMESTHMLQFASSSDPVNAFQEKREGGINVFTLSDPDLTHSQSEFENCKGLDGGMVVQSTLSAHSSESLKHGEDDLKEILSVTEECHSNSKSNQLTEEKEVLSPDMHVMDDSIKQGGINSEPMVEVTAQEHAGVSPVMDFVDGDQRLIEMGASGDSMKSEISKTYTVGSSEELGSDDVGKNLQFRNLLEGSVIAPSDDFEDFKDCEEEVSQKSFNNLHSTEAFKVKEDGLKDAISEENHSGFKPSQLSEESEIVSPDVHLSDDITKQEQACSEPQVENALAEEPAVVYPLALTAESKQELDEVRAFMNNPVNTEKNESHASDFSVEQKIDDASKTSQERSFPEHGVRASSEENLRNISIDSSLGQTSVVNRDGTSHCEEKRNYLDGAVLDSKCKGGDEESDIGIKVGTIQPSDLLLQLEGKTSSDLFKSDETSETGKTEKFDKNNTQGLGDSLVEDTLSPTSGSTLFECRIVSEDVMYGRAKKPTSVDSTDIDAVLGIKEGSQGDEIINNSKVQEECNTVSGTYSTSPQAQGAEPSKTVEKHARELPPHSHLDADQSAQSAVEDNTAVEHSGGASGTSVVTASDRNGNSLAKFGSSVIDASVDSSSRCDSLEGNWGSVSGETLPSAEAGKSNSNSSKAATQGTLSEKPDMFEPPSFMTLVQHDHAGPKAADSEGQKGHNPQQPNPSSSQAAWFPTLTQVVNDSQGRKKNEEIIAKVTNWSTSKQSSTPLKSLLGEAANSNKPKSPKLEENPVSSKNGKAATDNGSGLTTVNNILGPESPAAQAVRDEAGKEWNSPARYPAGIKREKRKVKSRPYWVQFVCCSSVDPR